MNLFIYMISLLLANCISMQNSLATNLDSPELYTKEYSVKGSGITYATVEERYTENLLNQAAIKLEAYKKKLERQAIIPRHVWQLIGQYRVYPEKQLMFSRAILLIYDDIDDHNIEHVDKFLWFLSKSPADQMADLCRDFPSLMHVLKEPFQPSIIYMSQFVDQFTKDYEEIGVQMFLYITAMVGCYPNCALIQGGANKITKSKDAHDILMLIYLNLTESRFPCGASVKMSWQDFNIAQNVISLIALDPSFQDLSAKSEYVFKLDAILHNKNYDRAEVISDLAKPETEKAMLIDECYANL